MTITKGGNAKPPAYSGEGTLTPHSDVDTGIRQVSILLGPDWRLGGVDPSLVWISRIWAGIGDTVGNMIHVSSQHFTPDPSMIEGLGTERPRNIKAV